MWWLMVLSAVGLAVGVGWWLRADRCQQHCARAVVQGEELAAGGDPLAALRLLDNVDARCNCARFTEGDEPPEYAAARVWLDQLRQECGGGDSAIDAHGPIVQELSGQRQASTSPGRK